MLFINCTYIISLEERESTDQNVIARPEALAKGTGRGKEKIGDMESNKTKEHPIKKNTDSFMILFNTISLTLKKVTFNRVRTINLK